ncbi:uncharacterized protein LOC100905969 [Galendromus occidentalis]|uniref:Uncharacterized protein LOC100905969 n=1 Tax=Galendromus occidentalis TaxID=34638 RepID=A0AAJ6VXF3_9ACAR|nr:uncharacterized protein LOC100905969 [Galendromus occidentalis]
MSELSPCIYDGLELMLADTNQTNSMDTPKWIDDADSTVIFGMALVAALAVGLGAYIAFVIRVTFRENRRRKRLEEILKNVPVSFNATNQSLAGVLDVRSRPDDDSGCDPGLVAAHNAGLHPNIVSSTDRGAAHVSSYSAAYDAKYKAACNQAYHADEYESGSDTERF